MTTEEKAKAYDSSLEQAKKELAIPKPANSIPSDYVSDTKYEDKWHKVKDSLPNSAREVLCRDAIGNFFIGRYYQQSQRWEVMMYDDCDKSNEDNPPVVKWCEIPTEKQEEQKPELVQQPPITYTYPSDASWDERLKAALIALLNSDLIKVAGNKFTKQDLIEWVERIPTDKPAEWSEEDSQIADNLCNELLHLKHDSYRCGTKDVYDEWIAWIKFLPERFNLQSKQEWSEEDKRTINSLRPSWKPSEEQMEALKRVAYNLIGTGTETDIYLVQLYEQLKKLL